MTFKEWRRWVASWIYKLQGALKKPPALIHREYAGLKSISVKSQGDGEGEIHIIKHRPLSVEYFYMCM